MLPVGVPIAGRTTAIVAVKITGCPKTEGLTLLVIVVVVLPLLTIWVKVELVEVAKLVSPE